MLNFIRDFLSQRTALRRAQVEHLRAQTIIMEKYMHAQTVIMGKMLTAVQGMSLDAPQVLAVLAERNIPECDVDKRIMTIAERVRYMGDKLQAVLDPKKKNDCDTCPAARLNAMLAAVAVATEKRKGEK